MFASPTAIAISTPYFTIYWYGIILAIAFLAGQFVVIKIAQKEYNDANVIEHLYELAFWTLFTGIISARLYYDILSFDYFSSHLNEIIMVQNGGISIQGGLLGGIIACLVYCKSKNINFGKYADLYAFGLPVAQAIGRWGNFFNSEAFGIPTNLPWAVFIPEINRPQRYANYELFHPTFLYESLLDILIFLILFFVIKKIYFNKHGIIFCSYLILYSVVRIFVECLRIDSVLNIFGIPIAILVSILTIILGVIFGLISAENNKK